MDEDVELYLQTAREALEEAALLISKGHFPVAVSRAYYADVLRCVGDVTQRRAES